MVPGFERERLRPRYEVRVLREDPWHAQSGEVTARFLRTHLGKPAENMWLLNAGAGIYSIGLEGWNEIPLDLFSVELGRVAN